MERIALMGEEDYLQHYDKLMRCFVRKRLRYYGLMRSGSTEILEDAFQEARIAMLEARSGYLLNNRGGNFEAYMCAFIGNMLYRWAFAPEGAGSSREIPMGHDAVSRVSEAFDDTGAIDQEDAFLTAEFGPELRRATKNLTQAERSVVVMRYAHDRTLRTVSEKLGRTINSVAKTERNALDKLRKQLSGVA